MAFLFVHEPCNAFWIWPRTVWSIYWHLDLCQFNSLVTLRPFWPNIFQLLRACFLWGLFCSLYIQSLCFEGLWQWFGVDHVGGMRAWELLRKGMLRHSHQRLSTFPFVVPYRISRVSQSFGKITTWNTGILLYTPWGKRMDGCYRRRSAEVKLRALLVTPIR